MPITHLGKLETVQNFLKGLTPHGAVVRHKTWAKLADKFERQCYDEFEASLLLRLSECEVVLGPKPHERLVVRSVFDLLQHGHKGASEGYTFGLTDSGDGIKFKFYWDILMPDQVGTPEGLGRG